MKQLNKYTSLSSEFIYLTICSMCKIWSTARQGSNARGKKVLRGLFFFSYVSLKHSKEGQNFGKVSENFRRLSY